MEAVTKPNEQTYANMVERPDAKPNTAYLWVFIAGTLSAIVNAILTAIVGAVGYGSSGGAAFGSGLIISICSSPIAGGVAVLFFAIGVGIIQWIAKMFGGTGSFPKLVYAMAAISVPISLVTMVLTPFNVIPYVNYCTGFIGFVVGIYGLVLEIMAVKGVNKFGWGQAAGSVLIPAFVLICCVIVAVFALSAMGLAVSDTFNSINQSIP
jgi:hypothetical protein